MLIGVASILGLVSLESPTCSEAAAHLIFGPVLEAPVPPSLATERSEAGRNGICKGELHTVGHQTMACT